MNSKVIFVLKLCFIYSLLLLVSACADNQQAGNASPPPGDTPGGYPGPAAAQAGPTADPGYPGPADTEQILPEPPNPERELPPAQGQNGVVGGVLVREVTGEGFVPLDPYELILGEVVPDNLGEPALIGFDENSPRAETFPTGVFIFREIPPGTYGLVVNLAVTQFPVKNPDGTEMLITVESGKAIDLGQVITEMP